MYKYNWGIFTTFIFIILFICIMKVWRIEITKNHVIFMQRIGYYAEPFFLLRFRMLFHHHPISKLLSLSLLLSLWKLMQIDIITYLIFAYSIILQLTELVLYQPLSFQLIIHPIMLIISASIQVVIITFVCINTHPIYMLTPAQTP